MIQIKVIGSAAGGGFPQWNCNFRLSRSARQAVAGISPRTQSSIAASLNGSDWILFNASPDIRQQIAATPQLQPGPDDPIRSTPIRAVVLTNADVDHIAGLLSLREQEHFALYATRRVLDVLEENAIFDVLARSIVPRRELAPDAPTEIRDVYGNPTGLVVEAFPVPGKIALFLEDENGTIEDFEANEGDTIGMWIGARDEDAALVYVPTCARIDRQVLSRLAGAKCLLFDGTLYTDDEMIRAGAGRKTGQRMGHVAISGRTGSMAMLSGVAIPRRVYLHINNTNPILDDNSPESSAVRSAGWEVAFDGMELVL